MILFCHYLLSIFLLFPYLSAFVKYRHLISFDRIFFSSYFSNVCLVLHHRPLGSHCVWSLTNHPFICCCIDLGLFLSFRFVYLVWGYLLVVFSSLCICILYCCPWGSESTTSNILVRYVHYRFFYLTFNNKS